MSISKYIVIKLATKEIAEDMMDRIPGWGQASLISDAWLLLLV